ncbi:MAG TPA: VIT1/CCC1 transporter family protein [Burkholderiales bacterium]|nr:VIT1/CCC1 transporter family protein [Burkholderiales bacterium]
MDQQSEAQRYRRNYEDEVAGAAMYAALAQAERDPVRQDLFRQLAEAENEHAALWRKKLEGAGVAVPEVKPPLKIRMLGWLARTAGVAFVLPTVANAEFADRNKYAGQHDAQTISAEERGHAKVIQAAAGHVPDGNVGRHIAAAEKGHRGAASGNNLRAAVLGANDGLVSNFCLIMGIAGAGTDNHIILLTGFAGLAAGACSMALGEWLSVTNARELAQTQMDREAEEIEQTPEAEEKELALIYQAKGLAKEDAQRIAHRLMRDKGAALDTLAREELGINPDDLGGNPWSAATTSFMLFSIGALFPLLPFVWLQGLHGIALSVGLSAFALAAIGLITSLFNGRSPLYSAVRQVVIGCVAAAITYGVGAGLGVSLS